MSRAVTIVCKLSRVGRSSTLDLLSLDVTWDAHALAALAASEEETQREDEVERTRLAMMRRYAEHTGCRRSFLLSYFGQEYRGPCGNCDNDLAPAEAERAEVPFAVGARVMSERWGTARSSGTTASRSRCCSTSRLPRAVPATGAPARPAAACVRRKPAVPGCIRAAFRSSGLVSGGDRWDGAFGARPGKTGGSSG